jgi:hypothetical protein
VVAAMDTFFSRDPDRLDRGALGEALLDDGSRIVAEVKPPRLGIYG